LTQINFIAAQENRSTLRRMAFRRICRIFKIKVLEEYCQPGPMRRLPYTTHLRRRPEHPTKIRKVLIFSFFRNKTINNSDFINIHNTLSLQGYLLTNNRRHA